MADRQPDVVRLPSESVDKLITRFNRTIESRSILGESTRRRHYENDREQALRKQKLYRQRVNKARQTARRRFLAGT